ncbi:YjcZ family sporulation protein [Sporosarcina soli]|uniref:YjcZ family sporulation protein n=1 Tax=Sporosarcina soli TaxID=334736 RepID=A0ABW0TS88_9BACL
MSGCNQGSSGFALIVVLFILLIIVGAAFLY